MFKTTIDGKEVELKAEDLQPAKEGYAIITPDRVPDGYFTQEAMQQKIQDRIASAKRNAEDELLSDKAFQKKVLSKYNILLDSEGKPKGLKPEVDIEEVKKQTAQQISAEYEEKLQAKEKQIGTLTNGTVRGDLLRAANGLFKDQYIKSFTGNDEPFVVKQFGDQFGVDPETGQTALKDPSGEGFAIDGQGNRITPDKYFESNADKFSDLLKDKRQRGSGFSKPGGERVQGEVSGDALMSMPDAEYAEYRKKQGFTDYHGN